MYINLYQFVSIYINSHRFISATNLKGVPSERATVAEQPEGGREVRQHVPLRALVGPSLPDDTFKWSTILKADVLKLFNQFSADFQQVLKSMQSF